MNPAAEKNLSEEIVSAKSRVDRFSVVIEKDKDGYFAFTPELQGCYSHRAILTRKPSRILGTQLSCTLRTGWIAAKKSSHRNR